MPLDFPEIRHRGVNPPYVQIADFLEGAIRAGDVPAGQELPSESEIMQATGTGRSTVRRAMERLRNRGLIDTIPQRGSYVRRDIPAE